MPIIGGSRLVSDRTAVDLPVPLRPQMRTPPIDGSMALRMRASRIFCCPTIALNGKVVIFSLPRCIGSITQECCMLSHGLASCQNDARMHNCFIASNSQHRPAGHSLSGDELRQMPATIRLH